MLPSRSSIKYIFVFRRGNVPVLPIQCPVRRHSRPLWVCVLETRFLSIISAQVGAVVCMTIVILNLKAIKISCGRKKIIGGRLPPQYVENVDIRRDSAAVLKFHGLFGTHRVFEKKQWQKISNWNNQPFHTLKSIKKIYSIFEFIIFVRLEPIIGRYSFL